MLPLYFHEQQVGIIITARFAHGIGLMKHHSEVNDDLTLVVL